MENSKCSLIIISRQRPHLLTSLLNSLRRQSLLPDEILLIENDFQSQYKDILDSFKELPIKYHLCSDIGVAHARNMGIKLAQNDLIAFIDDDCIASPTWLEQLLRPFELDPFMAMVGGKIEGVAGNTLSIFEEFSNVENALNHFGDE